MPESAISTGMVDFAVPAESMGQHLMAFARGLDLPSGAEDDVQAVAGENNWADARRAIYAILRNQVGHDFQGYKIHTFMRRVQRRMQVRQLESVDAYVEMLRQEPPEANALFRDLLITVTNFFRDADAFALLESRVIPKLFEGKGADDRLRIWVPGCATGEEVYSIGILLCEYMQTLTAAPRVQIFATDINEHALAVARTGRYPEALLDSVSPERRKRFFTLDGGSYHVAKAVRDLCVFSPHSVIRDPPFSRMDMVSCRNLLIYFGPDMQNQVIPTFHYALRPGGYLFLGTSENVSQFADLFTPLDKKHRMFRRRDNAGALARIPTFVPATGEARVRAGLQPPIGGAALRQIVDQQILDNFAPAYVVVNEAGDIVYYSRRTGKYLEAAQGVPTRHLLSIARKGLRLELRTAFKEAVETGRAVTRERVAVETEDTRIQLVRLTIEPVAERRDGESLFLILFADDGPLVTQQEADSRATIDDAAVHLERELRDTRERLQAMIEEYETSVEELKSANEELVSVNEEMQSSNEELEASKEEMQSLNEELHTVNGELHAKVEQLDLANSDLQNLFESTQVATVFLDRDMVIRSFTPAVSEIYNIRPSDRGRPITDLSTRISAPSFTDEVKEVLSSGQVIERKLDAAAGQTSFLARFIPYTSIDGGIEGVVLTFIDVSLLAHAAARQQVLISELNHRVKNILAVAVAIAERTSASAGSADDYKHRLVERLRAMGRSYAALSRDNWADVDLGALVAEELSGIADTRFVARGPALEVDPQTAVSLGMVMHELATNASKYGALADPKGRVVISWDKSDDELVLVWREHDGPPVTPPEHDGFGLELVKQEIGYNLGGRVELKFAPDGLVATLRCPLGG
ncbi:MAG: chemotaxis protein CheR [Burkholderiales bacterium]|nr:MAG: chemotaxis protein CheR [Burkholderiales bacterium]